MWLGSPLELTAFGLASNTYHTGMSFPMFLALCSYFLRINESENLFEPWLQAGWCGSSSSCHQLLVAIFSFRTLLQELQETIGQGSMEAWHCTLYSWTNILVADPEVVPFIIHLGETPNNFQQTRCRNHTDNIKDSNARWGNFFLFYSLEKQKIGFPSSLILMLWWSNVLKLQHKIRQQGVYESLHRDIMVHFGKWDFDPMELKNPFPDNEGSVHLWQGHKDSLVPFEMQRYLAQKLPWIQYHELPDSGHLIIHHNKLCEAIFRSLLLGEECSVSQNGVPHWSNQLLQACFFINWQFCSAFVCGNIWRLGFLSIVYLFRCAIFRVFFYPITCASFQRKDDLSTSL